jgi:hypothetical protein
MSPSWCSKLRVWFFLLCFALLRLLGRHLLQTVSESSLEAAVTWISAFLSQLSEKERHVDEYSSTAVSCPRCSAQCQFMAILKHWTQHRAVIVSALVHTGGLRNFIAWLSTAMLTFVLEPEFRNEFLTRWAMYVLSNIVARSRDHCWHGKAKIYSMFLHIVPNGTIFI